MVIEERELLRSLAQRIVSGNAFISDSARSMRSRSDLKPFIENMQESFGVALEGMGGGLDEELALETIVVREGRPVLLVEGDKYRLDGPESEIWQGRLELPKVRSAFSKIIPAIGRIEVENHPTYTWVGTGWLVDDDVIVTNRHVAELFSTSSGAGFVFRKGWPDPNLRMKAQIDFREEQGESQSNEFSVLDILYVEDDSGPDLAFLKVSKKSSVGSQIAGKLHLSTEPIEDGQFVATIGYPAADSRVPDQDLVRKLFGDVYNVKRMAPGQLLKPREELVLHDCSTLGGNSGSPIVDLLTGNAIGLHFSGLFLRENRGVPAAVLKDRLEKLRTGSIHPVPGAIADKNREESFGQLGIKIHQNSAGRNQTVRLNVTIPIDVAVSVVAGDAVVTTNNDNHLVQANPSLSVQPTIEKAVAAARTDLAGKPNVLAVRSGFVFRNGWITDDPAIVVVMRGQKTSSPEVVAIPKTLSGFPVEVRAASPLDYAESLDLIETLEGFPRTTYSPPENVTLEPVEEEMKVICHLCPDAGWPTLRDFLAETKKRLTIGMYDFTAPHIVEGVLSATDKQSRKLSMVLQEKESLGGGTKKFDIPEAQTIEKYSDALGDRFDFAWASVGKNHRFASAYHIKVAVRDGKAFWLSSGNWQSSNQPDHEIATEADGWNLLMKHNREWNIVIENAKLAGQFEAFLKHDLKQARADENIESPDLPSLEFFVEDEPDLERVPAGMPTYFEPLIIERSVRVQPLLTPDNYQQHVVKLIQSAEEQILFQNQSFSILDDSKNDPRYEAIFTSLLEKQQAGVDVRIIIRGDFGPELVVERLKQRGFDTDRIRLQNRCHIKGIVVDRSTALVGSHNWTNQGTLVNRDASLIFFDEEIAEYFAKAFWFDWKKLARKSVVGSRRVRLGDDRESPDVESIRLRLLDILN